MRYWPLTAVLLAFWMGRETGAEDTPAIARLDQLFAVQAKLGKLEVAQDVTCQTVMADRIVLRSDWRQSGTSKVRKLAILSANRLEFTTELQHQDKRGRQVKKTLLLNPNDGLVINGALGVAQIDVMGAEWARAVAREPNSSVRISTFEDGVTGASITVFDANGKRRAVLGAIAPPAGTRSTKSPPESRLTLFDRDGEVVAQVPAKK